MNKFILNSILFSVLLTFGVFLIGSIKLPDAYIINKTKNTSYEKVAWNLEVLNHHTEKIKNHFLFFGPSLFQTGICDSTLTSLGYPSINLAVNGAGNELELYFLKRALPYSPKKVFLHISKDIHHSLHNMTPLLYAPQDLISEGQCINADFFKYLFKRASYVLDYLVGFYSSSNQTHYTANIKAYGSRSDDSGFTNETYSKISENEMKDYFESSQLLENGCIKNNEKGKSGFIFTMIKIRRYFLYFMSNNNFFNNTKSQETFAKKSFIQADKYGVELSELYTPVIADAKSAKQFDKTFYTTQNNKNVISLNNFSHLNKSDYWADMTHLSKNGAQFFTKELVMQGIIK